MNYEKQRAKKVCVWREIGWIYSVIPLTVLCCTPVLADCIMHWGLTSLSVAGVVEDFTFPSYKVLSYSEFNRIPDQLYHHSRFSAVCRPPLLIRLGWYITHDTISVQTWFPFRQRTRTRQLKRGHLTAPYPALFFILPLFLFIEADTPRKKTDFPQHLALKKKKKIKWK